MNAEITPALIIEEARSWIGTPYHHQASRKTVGCDCLGLVRGVWRAVIGDEPEQIAAYSSQWAEMSADEQLAKAGFRHFDSIEIDAFVPGDLILFRWRSHLPAKHIAIVSDAQKMIHAQDGVSVCEVPITPWWRRKIAYAFRFRNLTPV